ncbi:Ankyrin repeats (3 copies) [Anatilimnocola aggregata]|uniref:Ankyrin repeats (3 copies) n=1 Tax=Anatilimnocola aggregata TaxID=2528021 RepID=A0A517Y6C5_9BACT|nr:ankyrin repeat domain-containing protein [Anatilimnocola aggregata]QDU25766.1 Ankyrin repeats (3 copies) [Anatilimnocola aggregata]
MVRGCLFALLMYAAIAVGYFFWLDTVFDRPESYYAAAGLGFVVFCCIGALMNARTAWKDWSLASNARHQFPPRDRQLFAAAGPIQPVGQPLLAPFSNAPCCLCEYDLSTSPPPTDSSEEKTGSDLAGFLMVPSEIQTGTGNVRLLGFPVLEEGTSYTLRSFTAARRARDFVSKTEFQDISGLRLLNAFAAIEDAWTDDDGSVEKNLQLKKVDPKKLFPDDLEAVWQEINGERAVEDPDAGISDEDLADEEDELENAELDDDELDDDDSSPDDSNPLPSIPLPTLKENRVGVGEQVVVIGRYDEMRRGVLPVGSGMKAIRLIRGDVDTLERKSRASLWSHLIGGLLFLVIAHAATYGAMYLYLNSESQRRKFDSEAFQAAQAGEISKLQAMQKKGRLNIDVRDTEKKTLLMVAKDAATAQWLIENKVPLNAADQYGRTALRQAAGSGHEEIVKLLIEAKADLNVPDNIHETPLLAADQTHPAIAEALRAAGAKDHVISAKNGQPLPEDGGPQLVAIRAYIQALRDRNAGDLYNLMTSPGSGDVAAQEWATWELSVLKAIERFEGYSTEDRATVTVYGTWGDNDSPAKSRFQLLNVGGKWKIARNQIEIN